MTVKLAKKMRDAAERLYGTKKDADAYALRANADRLDQTAASGTLTKFSASYRQAKLLYARVMGRPYEWGEASDLDIV